MDDERLLLTIDDVEAPFYEGHVVGFDDLGRCRITMTRRVGSTTQYFGIPLRDASDHAPGTEAQRVDPLWISAAHHGGRPTDRSICGDCDKPVRRAPDGRWLHDPY